MQLKSAVRTITGTIKAGPSSAQHTSTLVRRTPFESNRA